MANEPKSKQIHINFDDDPELFETVHRMAADEFMKSSSFIKRLVRQEAQRRKALAERAAELAGKRQSARPTA